MSIENEYQEVRFNQYCKTCEHENVPETEDPCNECLDNPANLYSHRPVKYKQKEQKKK
jgi:hypothetical protein